MRKPLASRDSANRLLWRTVVLMTVVFCGWAGLFIFRQSFVAIDGHRYFPLFDDAYISLRYGWYLSHGQGAVWNPGEYVEGYTNPLMVLLMAAVSPWFDTRVAPLAIQLIGVLFMLGSAWLAMLLARCIDQGDRSNGHRLLLEAGSFVAVLLYYPLVFMSLAGMETGLVSVLLTGSLLLLFQYSRSRRPAKLVLMTLCLWMAYLARPESILLAVGIFVYMFYEVWNGRLRATSVTLALGALAAFVAAHLIFRLGYYDALLPNTYYLKATGIPISVKLDNGIIYLGHFLTDNSLLLVAAVGSVVLKFSKEKLLLAALLGMLLGYQVWAGGDITLHARMIVMLFPVVLVMAVDGVTRLSMWLTRPVDVKAALIGGRRAGAVDRGIALGIAIAVAGLSALGLALYWPWEDLGSTQKLIALMGVTLLIPVAPLLVSFPRLPRALLHCALTVMLTVSALYMASRRYEPEWNLSSMPRQLWLTVGDVNTAILLDELLAENAVLGVVRAGAVPYYTQRKSTDFLGKTNSRIASLEADVSGAQGWFGMTSVPGHNKYDLDYSIKTLQPDYLEVARIGRQDLSEWVEAHYVAAQFKGARILLRRDSEAVHWDKITTLQARNLTLNSPEPFNWETVPPEIPRVMTRLSRLNAQHP